MAKLTRKVVARLVRDATTYFLDRRARLDALSPAERAAWVHGQFAEPYGRLRDVVEALGRSPFETPAELAAFFEAQTQLFRLLFDVFDPNPRIETSDDLLHCLDWPFRKDLIDPKQFPPSLKPTSKPGRKPPAQVPGRRKPRRKPR